MKSKKTKKSFISKPIGIYKHKDKKRKNNPHVGTVTSKTEAPKVRTKKYKYDPHLDPELQWAGKAERVSFEVPSVSLHVHEKIDPRSIIETVRARNSVDYEQLSLFHDPKNQISADKEAEYYKHERLWSNRMIAGDSLLVMNSLLEKEGMAGKVQCIYIDPPYGIKYGSNFQPFTNKRDVKDKKDEDLTAEPETLKAFRDTWELGIHSYLTYMRDRLLLAKELLTESGSCFVQISDENVHLIRNLMDEIFGVSNFCRLIPFRKRQGRVAASKLPEQGYNFLIWFCKNKKFMKYNKIFTNKSMEKLELFYDDSKRGRVALRKDEKLRIKPLPVNIEEIYTRIPLELQSLNPDRKFTLTYKGKEWIAPPKGWSASKKELEKAIALNRLTSKGRYLLFKRYYNESNKSAITATWTDTSGVQSSVYVVQVSSKVVQRCLLMTTDPGDLVFDPTCGSGTTAYIAEKWGRRWITCDTSRVAIALAKQRLMTANFDYYELKNEKEGISSGFNYETVPHVTLRSIANNEPAPEEILYDQPIKDSKKARVTGPFTVEAVPAHKVESLSATPFNGGNNSLKETWFEELKINGIRGKKGLSSDITFTRLEYISGTEYIYAEGETNEENPKRVIICFGSEYAPLEQRQIEEALKEAKNFSPKLVIFCAFQFDPEAGKDVDHLHLDWTTVLKVQMNSDLLTNDLKKKTKGNSFWLVGQPDIKIIEEGEKYKVIVEGFDYYNTTTNSIEMGGKNKIAMWMLDTNYDERSVYPRQVFFPISSNEHDWTKLKKTLGAEIDENLINKFIGTESIPFELGNHKKIAVKIIDDRGIESLIVKALD